MPPHTDQHTGDHTVPLGRTGRRVWKEAVLRTAGFPATGLTRLGAPACAAVADAHLAGTCERAHFEAALAAAADTCAHVIDAITADPLLREAMTWQNRTALTLLDSLARSGPPAPRNTTRRRREQDLSRYWQRYCAKAETIGFFGPSAWIRVDPTSPETVSLRPGPTLVDRRRVFFEPWALGVFGNRLAEDPAIRAWLPPVLHSHLALDGLRLLRPGAAPLPLTAQQAQVIARCDGETPAEVIARRLAADPDTTIDDPREVHRILARLGHRRLIGQGANLPTDARAEATLRRRLTAIEDPLAGGRARASFARLLAARTAIEDAGGDSGALATALDRLDSEFTALTGHRPSRNHGKTYAGRGLCYEDTTRAVDATIGGAFLDRLAPPLDIVLQATRWFGVALVEAYERELTALYEKVAGDRDEIDLGALWGPALRLFWSEHRRPVDDVMEAFAGRWHAFLGLDTEEARTPSVLRLRSADLAPAVHRVFPADRPGWSAARLHSPDLQIRARSLQDINSGAYEVVLGEMHACAPTMAVNLFTWSADDPEGAARQVNADHGRPRIVPLLPATWPRNTGRMVPAEPGAGDLLLGFTPAPGVERRRLIPTSAVRLRRSPTDARVTAELPDGTGVPLAELFGVPLTLIAVDAYKSITRVPHMPRVAIDHLVILRETWRTTVDAVSLPPRGRGAGGSERDDYLAIRRWRAQLGCPERVFAKIEGEMKPVFVDFTSPVFVASLCTLLRTAGRRLGPDAELVVSEALPDPEETWVQDSEGRGYVSELRLHVADGPQSPGTR
ncbi:lantibiotic dehydratase [Streptomyces sp. NPDC096198]|uniref:lantibiotic dehydratase n=1 Tax=Streptomyces sp. NPDC096198 TaxID=3366080 RepID=UPI00380A3642